MLPIVDTSVTTTKKILVSELAQALLVLRTEQAATSGTAIDFTGIPAWVKEITIMFVGVSTSGTSNLLIQIGDSGGIETSGYLGSAAFIGNAAPTDVTNYTDGFGISNNSAASVRHGSVVLSLQDSSDFTWVANGNIALSNTTLFVSTAGSKALSAALTQVRITTTNGTDTFDAGAININYS